MRRRNFLASLAGAGASAWSRIAAADSVLPSPGVMYLAPGHAEYAAHAAAFNARITTKPKLIALCFNEDGVRQAIARAGAEELAVAVKSGGHGFEGFSLNDDGLVIDLSPMQRQELRADGRYLVEPACRLMQGYEYLVPRGRLLTAGSCGMVGIAGLTLGGGYGIFSRRYGLTCDALRRVRLIDGRGEIHEVSEGDELMWACRGGGNGHFGVVTQMEFDTVPAPANLWRHVFKETALDPGRVSKIARGWFELAAALPRDAFSAFVLSRRALTVLVTSTNEEPTTELTSALRALENIIPRRQAGKKEDLARAIRRYYGVLSPLPFKNASAGYYKGYGDIEPVALEVFQEVLATPELLFQINTLGGAIDNPALEERACYSHRKYPFLGEIQSYWENPAREPPATAAVARVQALLRKTGIRAHYCNYPDIEFQDWENSYYGSRNYERLRKLKRRLDPRNLFRHAQSVAAA